MKTLWQKEEIAQYKKFLFFSTIFSNVMVCRWSIRKRYMCGYRAVCALMLSDSSRAPVAQPVNSVGSDAGCQSRGLWVRIPARPIFFPTFDKSHCDKPHSFYTNFTNGLTVYVEKQPASLKVYCVEYWCEQTRKDVSRWIGRRDMTEKLLKTALKNIKINK